MPNASRHYVGTILMIIAVASSSCSRADRTPFTKWMYADWSAGPYVRAGSRIAALHADEEALRRLQFETMQRGIDAPELHAAAAAALDAEWADADLQIHSIARGSDGEIWLHCSRVLSATCTQFVGIAIEQNSEGRWLIACALMTGTS